MKKQHYKYVIFASGETAGPVMPLLAIADAWTKQDGFIKPIFLDRRKSVAARIIPAAGYKFIPITTGKMRRYWSPKNILSPFQILWGILKSFIILLKYRPKIVIGAGGYVQVPVMIAAWMMGIPRLIHQQDIVPTFSNRLVSIIANKITVTFEKSTKDFFQGSGFEKNYQTDQKIFWTGNPSRLDIKTIQSDNSKAEGLKLFKLKDDLPVVLVMGGGSGAMGLNNLVIKNLPDLIKSAQVIHSAGAGKRLQPPTDLPEIHDRYRQYEFIDHMNLAYAASDIIISRAGVGTITELAIVGKPSIVIPMPDSHQEWNAQFLFDHQAALILDQSEVEPDTLGKLIRKVMFDAKLQKNLQKNISNIMPLNATQNVLNHILSLIHD
jgi:UDP-N-acetylglucosamine--N-acetylmuramyl-(pentapeptide) pyrophosphoryl-undecaprenol N-acetylglucosamine transferase